jgi:uncharacterized protein (TIGR02246 family)
MNKKQLLNTIWMVLLFCCSSCERSATNEESAIAAQAAAYEAAYNRGDAVALSHLWVEDGKYINPETGEEIEGRADLESYFKKLTSSQPAPSLKLQVHKISFPTDGEAVEIGTAAISREGKPAGQAFYKAIYRKEQGKWLLTEVREVESGEITEQNEQLKGLGWLVGDWIDADEDMELEISYRWDRYKNFLIQSYTLNVEGNFEQEGRQLIGWDPINQKVRSWLFDSDGGFGEGSWQQKEDSWVAENVQTLADGRRASSINIITPLTADSYSWQSVGREVGGELLADIAPVTVVRKKGE